MQQPPIKEFSTLRLDWPTPVTLDNGIPVWVVGNGDDDICRMALYIAGGNLEEPRPLVASMTANLAVRASRESSAAAVAEAFDYYGAWRSARAHDHCVALTLSSLKRNFEQTCALFCQCVLDPSFPQDEVELLKGRLASSYSTAQERVSFLAERELLRMHYGPNHKLAQMPTPEGIAQVTTADIAQFWQQHYHNANVRVILSGKITSRELRIVNNTLGKWHVTGPALMPQEQELQPSTDMMRIADKPGALQSAVQMIMPTVQRRHPHYFALRILNTVLGGYFSSRLSRVIREERGYTYGIGSILAGHTGNAYLKVATECATQHTRAVIDEAKHQLQLLREQLIPELELKMVKQNILSNLATKLDTPLSIAEYMGTTFTSGTWPEYYNQHVDALKSCSAQQLLGIAQEHLDPAKFRIAIAGDKAEIEKQY